MDLDYDIMVDDDGDDNFDDDNLDDNFNLVRSGSCIVRGRLNVWRIHIQGGATSTRYIAWGDSDDDDDGNYDDDDSNDYDDGGNNEENCCSSPGGEYLNAWRVMLSQIIEVLDLTDNISNPT